MNNLQVFELEIDDEKKYRSLAEANWDTYKRKNNKIIISTPLCVKEKEVTPGGLLTGEMIQAYPGYEFYKLQILLTLLPDLDCRFRSVDFILELSLNGVTDKKPLFLALDPLSLSSKKIVKISNTETAKMGISDKIFKVLSAEVGGTEMKEEQYDKFESNISSFGKLSQKAGWRFAMTDSQEIAISSPDLKVLVAVPSGQKVNVSVKLVAEIDIKKDWDKFLSLLFLRTPPPKVSVDFQIPL